jgi:ankyrin repeat protein
MSAPYEQSITKTNLAAAIKSFARDAGRIDSHGSLLGYLLFDRRAEEAALLLDQPGQVVSKTLPLALQALARDPSTFPLFEAIVAKRPPLHRSADEDPNQIRLPFLAFGADQEELCLRAVRALAEAYGHEGAMKGGETLLHAVVAAGHHAPIAYLLARGASREAKDDSGLTPFERLFAGRCSGVTAETISLLQCCRPPDEALGAYLAVVPAARPFTEVRAVVQALLASQAKVEEPYGDHTPLAHALLLERPLSDRRALAELLVAAGASHARALPSVVETHRPASIEGALAIAQPKPGAIHGKAGQTLLHLAAAALEGDGEVDEEQRAEQRTLPVLRALLAFGESPNALDKKGKTPLDLARKHRRSFPAKDWKRIEALLTPDGPAPSAASESRGAPGEAHPRAAKKPVKKTAAKKPVKKTAAKRPVKKTAAKRS